ncbi:MAG TPA: glutamine synthetase, partial [Sutterella sp.]|nr:glutamine synthetase [Sutterella sp.]
LAYSACNRSASIRIPHAINSKAIRVEVRFPDPMANSYLAFSAMLMAGLDGIARQIHPGEAADKNLYDLPPEENRKIATISASLDEALRALEADHDFLTKGGVFSDDMLEAYIAMKDEEVTRLRMEVSPAEYDMYFKL